MPILYNIMQQKNPVKTGFTDKISERIKTYNEHRHPH